MKRLLGFRSATALVIVTACVGAWTACVGDESTGSSNGSQGAQDQPCYANGTCLAGLTCESGRCKPANAEGGAQTSSGGTSSGGTSSSSSGSTCTASAVQDGPRCGSVDAGACPKGESCCAADGGGFACSTGCAADAGWQCEDGTKQCSDAQGHICCISVAKQSGTDTCGAKAFTNATSRCVQTASDCVGLKDYRVCNTADDCVGGRALKACVLHDVETVSGSRFALGVCEAR